MTVVPLLSVVESVLSSIVWLLFEVCQVLSIGGLAVERDHRQRLAHSIIRRWLLFDVVVGISAAAGFSR